MYSRGSDEIFMKFQLSNWDEFTTNIDNEPHGKQIIRLYNGEYISEKLLEKLIFLSPDTIISNAFSWNRSTFLSLFL